MPPEPPTLRLSNIVGRGYDECWNTRCFYRVVKGSRGSKKSKTAALWYIFHLMKYPDANLLVVRRIFSTLKDSCFAELLWAINRLGVADIWTSSINPLEIRNTQTKQKIIFRGMDDPQKITSIAVTHGFLCWVWVEEAFQITNEDDFDKMAMSIRGRIPLSTGLFKQITLTFNPWSEHTWIKKRFFDEPALNVFTDTTTYRDNEFLDDVDIQRFEDTYRTNPRAARVVCDGEWGRAEGLIYENWFEEDFDVKEILNREGIRTAFGLDYGYAVSFNAFIAILVDMKTRDIWVYDEMYKKGMTNLDIARKICEMGYGKEEIWADSAEPKSNYELAQGLVEEIGFGVDKTYVKWQLPNVRPALKGADSVANGIQRIQSFKIHVLPRCQNTILELNNYAWDEDKDGILTGKPIKDFDHLMDAMRYAMTKFFIRAKGSVVEAKGVDEPLLDPEKRYKSRRVVSSN